MIVEKILSVRKREIKVGLLTLVIMTYSNGKPFDGIKFKQDN